MRVATLIVRPSCAAALLLGAALLGAVLAAPAGAVIITTNSDAANLQAPAVNPGWNNVGRIANASGVYLGNRWVITANHVSSGALRLSDGRDFAVSVGSGVRLTNAGMATGSPDLRMFRLAADPGLPALDIAETPPTVGANVMMIGAGIDRAPEVTGWQVIGSSWTEASLRFANTQGYKLLSTAEMRWGINLVSAGTSFGADQTFSFATRFDRFSLPFEAQAVVGDSGGGVFHEVDGTWELTGIITSNQPLAGQPASTAVFGDHTFIADLSRYRAQITEMIDRDEPLWQNPANRYDVSGSGQVEPRDFLLLANELARAGPHALTGAPGTSDGFFDVNGDYQLTTSDAQQIINALLGGTANPTGSTSGLNFVPEPSTALLAILGCLLFALSRRRFPLSLDGRGGRGEGARSQDAASPPSTAPRASTCE